MSQSTTLSEVIFIPRLSHPRAGKSAMGRIDLRMGKFLRQVNRNSGRFDGFKRVELADRPGQNQGLFNLVDLLGLRWGI